MIDRPPPTAARRDADAVLIGGSAGALEAVTLLLAALPSDFALPLVVVIHLPRQRPSALVEALRRGSALPLREAQDKEPLAPGAVYVAPPDYHLLLDPGPVLALSVDEPVSFSRPSIDVLFESAADVLGAGCVGVLVSGANSDGAGGLLAIQQAGGLAIIQSPDEAAHRAMPEAALAACPSARVLPVEGIARLLRELSTRRSSNGAGTP